ncbi:DUF2380 domain-containing protein [Spirosoma koreense]
MWYKIDRIMAVNALFPGVGVLRASSVAFKATNFRISLRALQGAPPATKAYHAHHIFARKFEAQFAQRGINIHEPRFGVWWEARPHLDAAAYNREWEKFFRTYPNATRDEVFQFSKSLMAKYDLQFLGSSYILKCDQRIFHNMMGFTFFQIKLIGGQFLSNLLRMLQLFLI